MDPIPLPPEFPSPPPEHLRRCQVLQLFKNWGIGDSGYLKRLVQSRILHVIPRPPLQRGGIYKTAEIFKLYNTVARGGYIRQLLQTSQMK
jgi:hypothetical protein